MENNSANVNWDERASAPDVLFLHSSPVFESLFERSADAIWLFELDDGQKLTLMDCNQAAVDLVGAENKSQVLHLRPEDLSPPFQLDGSSSADKTAEVVGIVQRQKAHRLEWMLRRLDGREIPIEVSVTFVLMGGKSIYVVMSRDISERKKAERELVELTQALERRVTERTAALTTSEARLRAMVEHAPEAIVVFDGDSGRFLFGNQHACTLYGVPMAKLTELTPAEVSPERQPCGRLSSGLAREKMDEALRGGTPIFEWIHRQPNGRLVPTEVRLLRLPAEGQNLIRASIIDNTERKQAEEALRQANSELHREIEQRIRAEKLLNDRVRISTLNADIAVALNAAGGLRTMLQQCAQLVVRHLDVAFARVWTLNEASQILELEASAGLYTHLDGPHSRVRVGQYKIGLIAREKKPLLTNNVQTDPRVSDHAWAVREGMVAFAGYPLLIEDRVLGVLALFARRPLDPEILKTLGSIADSLALGIERKRAQTALAESEARFGAAFQGSPILIGISRMSDRCFVLVNDAFANWSGYPLEEILGRDTAELGFWERLEEREELWAELRRTGWVRERECRLRNRSGKSFTMLVSSKVIQINDVPHVLSMALDISHRKETEAELVASEARLRESETRFNVAFQASPVFISIFKVSDEKYVLANDALLNWLGARRDEVLGRTSGELGIWDDPAERDLVWHDLRSIGSIRQRECRWRNRRGERFTILLSVETISLENQPHVLSLALDISQRKQAELELRASEARLRESEARFSVAFQASPIFISILRVDDGKFVLANDALINWLGCPRNEALGQSCAELGMWENIADRTAVWEELARTGCIRQKECRWLNRRGERFTILLSAEMITVDNAPHALLLALDITQRKQADVEILKSLAREKELSQLKSNFVSLVSHEFRTPLGIIQSSAELLGDFYQRMQPDERAAQLESITWNTRRMAGMMEEILVLSRLDAGKLDFQPELVDFDSFCRRVVDEVVSATNRRCAIDLALNSVPLKAEADERLLGHIFTNLLSNAVKYSEPGQPVRFVVERDGPYAVCVVQDRGIGISEEDQQQLFKAFHRGSNVGPRPGTGLGLMLVKRCADLHGGTVHISSKVGEGTTVVVRLPLDSKPA